MLIFSILIFNKKDVLIIFMTRLSVFLSLNPTTILRPFSKESFESIFSCYVNKVAKMNDEGKSRQNQMRYGFSVFYSIYILNFRSFRCLPFIAN